MMALLMLFGSSSVVLSEANAQTCPATSEEVLDALDEAIDKGDLRTSRFLSRCQPQSIYETLVLTEGDDLELPTNVEQTVKIGNERAEKIHREYDFSWLPDGTVRRGVSGLVTFLDRWFEDTWDVLFVVLMFTAVFAFNSRLRHFLVRSPGGKESKQSPFNSALTLGLRFQATGDIPAFLTDPNFVLSSWSRGFLAFGHPVSNLFYSGSFPTILNYRIWGQSSLFRVQLARVPVVYVQTVYCFKNRRRNQFRIMTTETAETLAKIQGRWAALAFRLGMNDDRKDLKVGDTPFDDRFHIEGTSESELRTIFHSHLRVQLMKDIDEGLIIEATPDVTIFYRFQKVDRGDQLTHNYRRYKALHSAIDG